MLVFVLNIKTNSLLKVSLSFDFRLAKNSSVVGSLGFELVLLLAPLLSTQKLKGGKEFLIAIKYLLLKRT